MKPSIVMVLFCVLLLLAVNPARAELVLVAGADSGIRRMSKQEVINVYMGRFRHLDNGVALVPLDIAGEAAERKLFYHSLLDKTLAEINAYWAHLIFSGKTSAPEEVASQREVLERVVHESGAVGYVERINLNPQVKVVYEFVE